MQWHTLNGSRMRFPAICETSLTPKVSSAGHAGKEGPPWLSIRTQDAATGHSWISHSYHSGCWILRWSWPGWGISTCVLFPLWFVSLTGAVKKKLNTPETMGSKKTIWELVPNKDHTYTSPTRDYQLCLDLTGETGFTWQKTQTYIYILVKKLQSKIVWEFYFFL